MPAQAPPNHDRPTASAEKHAACAHEPPADVEPASPRPSSRASSRPPTPHRSGSNRPSKRPRSRTPKRSAAEGLGPLEPPAHPTLRTLSFWFAAVDNAGLRLKRLESFPKHRAIFANIVRALDRMQQAFDFKLMYHATTHPAARELLRWLAARIKQLAKGTVEMSPAEVDTWNGLVKAVPPGLLIMRNESLLALEQVMFDSKLMRAAAATYSEHVRMAPGA
ncbi:hypothetical protein KFL_007040020 [Klebsormidium nitens]|uniref:Uncharacterized protein n=1 Tax=Klebsormidium nitens TaxID=105231 RepID=A0A1Y1IJH6_KLENI|nr:hypothetical protein KFL_007040020 [Klebsormidium nitens]|eukprot:GAQ90934.1 hypothetical protein KFL_007040020 [Klebsormidium nitens]